MENTWYVLKTVSGQENKIKTYLETEVQNLGFKEKIKNIFVPKKKVKKVKKVINGKKIQLEKVFYPGYIMIEMYLDVSIKHAILKTPDVINFLCEGKKGEPLPLRKYEISNFLGKTDEIFENDASIPFIVGEKVKVIDGPFNGFYGTIEEIFEEKRKVSIEVLIFGRKTPLNLNLSKIEKII